jgi:hypothetical protein
MIALAMRVALLEHWRVAMVWWDCSGGHGSDHGADCGADHGADRDNGFLIGGMVAGMQIPSCFVVMIVQGCVPQKVDCWGYLGYHLCGYGKVLHWLLDVLVLHLWSKFIGSGLQKIIKNRTAERGSGLNDSNFRQNLEFCRISTGIWNLARIMAYQKGEKGQILTCTCSRALSLQLRRGHWQQCLTVVSAGRDID